MDNKEYVLEKLAMNFASTPGRILALFGHKQAKAVIKDFKNLYNIALKKGYTSKSFGGFLKEMNRDPAYARAFINDADEVLKTSIKETGNQAKQWSIFKPWSRSAKIGVGVGATVLGAGGGYYYLKNKQQQETPMTEEEMIYQQMMQQQQGPMQ